MKTNKLVLPAIALLFGTLLSVPVYAQNYGDYHDQEPFQQTKNIEKDTNTVQYLSVGYLLSQMNEDLPINYDELSNSATNSIKDNKISNEDQYELMATAIQTKHNQVLSRLLQAGFDINIDQKLSKKVATLSEIAESVQNYEANDIIATYAPKMFKKTLKTKKIEHPSDAKYLYHKYEINDSILIKLGIMGKKIGI